MGRYRGHVENVTRIVSMSTIVVFPVHLSHNPSTSSAVKTPEYAEEDCDDPEPADGGIQMEYSLLSCTMDV